ncbi:MAG: esterase-like activity of phytase family protein [Cyanobacteriota bacterium]|nr:esterase-like activity of phytase family protein [Cyanobacteriota bacterium]
MARRVMVRLLVPALVVLCSTSAVTATAAPLVLPCPLAAGWQRLVAQRLPRRDGDGQVVGGLSAVVPVADGHLELLSDAPRPVLVRIDGLGTAAGPRLLQRLALTSGSAAQLPATIDGEAFVRRGADLWVASEGRRSVDRPAQLLRFDRAGRLRQALDLPADWQPGPGRGLAANGGPESLALLQRPGQADALLMAAEFPLLQDPPGQVRLLAWSLATAPPRPQPLAPLLLPRGDWGLTDLLPVPDGGGGTWLLALLRRFDPPDRWGARLALYPLPPPLPVAAGQRQRPVAAVYSWNLLAGGAAGPGLPADNWEALAMGPPQADGTSSLVLASDDNFNPFQDNHLVLLAPRRRADCPASP